MSRTIAILVEVEVEDGTRDELATVGDALSRIAARHLKYALGVKRVSFISFIIRRAS